MSTQVLNQKTFTPANEALVTGGRPTTRTMSIGGTALKAAVLLIVTLAFATFGWNRAETVMESVSPIVFILGFVALLGLTFVAVRYPRFAAVVGFFYAVFMGTFIGAISRYYDAAYDGIVGQALFATLAVFGATLALYGFRIVRVTNRFVNTVIGATAGVVVFYLASLLLGVFGVDMTWMNQPTPLGIGISVVISLVAAANLFLDYAFIEGGAQQGAPKAMEWLGAFGLLTTLVWLYLELLRLLSLLRS